MYSTPAIHDHGGMLKQRISVTAGLPFSMYRLRVETFTDMGSVCRPGDVGVVRPTQTAVSMGRQNEFKKMYSLGVTKFKLLSQVKGNSIKVIS